MTASAAKTMLKHSTRMMELDCPDPKGMFGKSGTHRIVWYEWGEPSAKPVLCVHGLTRNGHDFDFFAEALVKKGYRVICPDVVGRGKSAWLENPKHYGYPLYCADMLFLLDHLGIKTVDWVGTSMGGLMGMMIAATHPERISRLVLNDIGSFIPKAALMRIGAYISQRISFRSMEDGKEYLRNAMATFGIFKEEHWDHLTKFNFIREPGGSFHIAYDPALSNAFRLKSGKPKKMPDMDFSKLWGMVKCPVLVIRGAESDLLLKETAEKMAAHKDVELIEFENCGHAPMLMDEAQIKPVVKWLSQ